MNITEDMLDQLEALKVKRIKDIATNGTEFSIPGSVHTIKGLYDRSKNTITVPATNSIRPGITIKAPGAGELYISDIQAKAGVNVLDVLPVKGELTVFTKHGEYFQPAGTIHVIDCKSSELGIPAGHCVPTGTVISYKGLRLTVEGTRKQGGVLYLSVEEAPGALAQRELKHVKLPNLHTVIM